MMFKLSGASNFSIVMTKFCFATLRKIHYTYKNFKSAYRIGRVLVTVR